MEMKVLTVRAAQAPQPGCKAHVSGLPFKSPEWALDRVLSNPSPQVKSISFFYVAMTPCVLHTGKEASTDTSCVKGSITGDPTEIAQLQSSWLADLGISKPRIISQVFIGSQTHSSILLWYTMGLTPC